MLDGIKPTNAGNEIEIQKARGGASNPRRVINKALSPVHIRARNRRGTRDRAETRTRISVEL